MVIVHAIAGASKVEWKIAKLIDDLAKKLKAKEIITLEGVASQEMTNQPKAFFYSTKCSEKLKKEGEDLKIIISELEKILGDIKEVLKIIYDSHRFLRFLL